MTHLWIIYINLASKNGVTHPKKKIEFSHFPLH